LTRVVGVFVRFFVRRFQSISVDKIPSDFAGAFAEPNKTPSQLLRLVH
jgi:hypothetical protein